MSDTHGKSIFNNNANLYRNYLKDRNLEFVRQYSSPTFNYPSADDLQDIILHKHIWTMGDRFYKLGLDYYGSTEHWWIIPWFNQKPLESDYEYGEVIYVPLPLEEILALT